MSLAIKYQALGLTTDGKTALVSIYFEGYAGAVLPLQLRDNPVTIKWQKGQSDFAPLLAPSSASITILDDLADTIQNDIFNQKEGDVVAEVSIDGSVYWRGAVLTDVFSGALGGFVHQFTITAKCGLNRLSAITYDTPSGFTTGARLSIIDAIREILNATVTQFDVRVLSDLQTAATSYFEADFDPLAMRDDAGNQLDCKSVLQSLIPPGFKLMMSAGSWWIVQRSIQGDASKLVGIYPSGGGAATTENAPAALSVLSDLARLKGVSRTRRPGYNSLVLDYRHGTLDNDIIGNASFEKDTDWTGFYIRVNDAFSGTKSARLEGSEVPDVTVVSPSGGISQAGGNIVGVQGNLLRIKITHKLWGGLLLVEKARIYLQVKVGANYLKSDGTWSATREVIYTDYPTLSGARTWITTDITSVEVPATGQLEISLYAPYLQPFTGQSDPATGYVLWDAVDVSVTDDGETEPETKRWIVANTNNDVTGDATVNMWVGDGPTSIHKRRLTISGAETGNWVFGSGVGLALGDAVDRNLMQQWQLPVETHSVGQLGIIDAHRVFAVNGNNYDWQSLTISPFKNLSSGEFMRIRNDGQASLVSSELDIPKSADYRNASSDAIARIVVEAQTLDWSRISGKPATFPPDPHTHDDRYYTEAEVDAKKVAKTGDIMTGSLIATKLHATNANDANLGSTGHGLQAGVDSGKNVAIGNNEILARDNGAVTTLHLNAFGGHVDLFAGMDPALQYAVIFGNTAGRTFVIKNDASSPTEPTKLYNSGTDSGRGILLGSNNAGKLNPLFFETVLKTLTFLSGFGGNGASFDVSGSKTKLEVDDLIVRGQMSVYELLIQQVRATNGSLIVSDVAKVQSITVVSGGVTYDLFFDTGNNYGHPFQVGDILLAQRVDVSVGQVYKSIVEVASVVDASECRVTLLDGSQPAAGMEFVRIGSATDTTRQGVVFMSSSDTGAPFIRIIDGSSDENGLTESTNIRAVMGNLEGMMFNGSPLPAGTYGIWTDKGYFTGEVVANAGNIAGWTIGPDAISKNNTELAATAGFAGLRSAGTNGDRVRVGDKDVDDTVYPYEDLSGNIPDHDWSDPANINWSVATVVGQGDSEGASQRGRQALNGNFNDPFGFAVFTEEPNDPNLSFSVDAVGALFSVAAYQGEQLNFRIKIQAGSGWNTVSAHLIFEGSGGGQINQNIDFGKAEVNAFPTVGAVDFDLPLVVPSSAVNAYIFIRAIETSNSVLGSVMIGDIELLRAEDHVHIGPNGMRVYSRAGGELDLIGGRGLRTNKVDLNDAVYLDERSTHPSTRTGQIALYNFSGALYQRLEEDGVTSPV